MDLNKRFAELCSLCWHRTIQNHLGNYTCSCGKEFDGLGCFTDQREHKQRSNPDFISDPRLVLVEMEKKGLLGEFVLWLLFTYTSFEQIPHFLQYFILDKIQGNLVKGAIEFLERGEGE